MTDMPVIDDYMTREIISLGPEMDIHAAIKTLIEHRISGAPVVDEAGNLVGILTKKDCLKVAFAASYHQDLGGRVSEYMSAEVETVQTGTSIVDMAERFLGSTYRRYPVFDDDRLSGLISRHDILRAIEEQW